MIEYLILGYPLMCSNFFYLYSTPVASHVAGSYTTSRRADEGRRPRAEAKALTSLQHTLIFAKAKAKVVTPKAKTGKEYILSL